MYKILVILPFSLRMDSDTPVREFAAGKHTLSEEEYGHWFVQGCIAEGRAELLGETADAEGAEDTTLDSPTREELLALTAVQLRELCEAAGITVPGGNPAKAALADLLLAGAEGVTLVKGPDGVFVQKQEKPADTPVQTSEAK